MQTWYAAIPRQVEHRPSPAVDSGNAATKAAFHLESVPKPVGPAEKRSEGDCPRAGTVPFARTRRRVTPRTAPLCVWPYHSTSIDQGMSASTVPGENGGAR